MQAKDPRARRKIADRIRALDADVVLVQEVEHRDALREFNRLEVEDGGLGGRYSWVACIDGNDRRRIDVGVLSRLPIGGVTSWQHVIHPDLPEEPIFRRDLLEIDILDRDFEHVELTCFVTHLKSHHVPWEPAQTPADVAEETARADRIRGLEADMIARILARRSRDRPFLVAGDLNDPPDAPSMRPLREAAGLLDGLQDAVEDPPYRLVEEDPPLSPVWSHRHREGGHTTFALFDHLWLSAGADAANAAAGIARRSRKGGDDSDHDPVWVDLDL